jgi:hypothetical protein
MTENKAPADQEKGIRLDVARKARSRNSLPAFYVGSSIPRRKNPGYPEQKKQNPSGGAVWQTAQ